MQWDEYVYQAALMSAWVELMAQVEVQINKPAAKWNEDGTVSFAFQMGVKEYIELCWRTYHEKNKLPVAPMPPMPPSVLYAIDCKQEMVMP